MVTTIDINMQDSDGNSLPHFAVCFNNMQAAQALCELDALSLKNKQGKTPVMLAMDAYEMGDSSFFNIRAVMAQHEIKLREKAMAQAKPVSRVATTSTTTALSITVPTTSLNSTPTTSPRKEEKEKSKTEKGKSSKHSSSKDKNSKITTPTESKSSKLKEKSSKTSAKDLDSKKPKEKSSVRTDKKEKKPSENKSSKKNDM